MRRFLRSKDLDLDKAQAMVQHTLEWRKTYGADEIAGDETPACLATVAMLEVSRCALYRLERERREGHSARR